MPPRKRVKVDAAPTKTRKGGRRKKQDDNEVPLVYQEMLAEAAMSSQTEESARRGATKRRRLSVDAPKTASPAPSPEPTVSIDVPASSPARSCSPQRHQQTIYEDFSSSEDESEAEFEDVTLDKGNINESEPPEQMSLRLDLSRKILPRSAINRRKPVSKAERDYRLNVHKSHIILLLINLQLRRRWCESEDVQAILKPLISHKLRNMLHVGDEKPAYQRAHSFNKAIEEICTMWRDEFEITRSGMRRAFWREDVNATRELDDFDDPSNYEEFLEAAGTRHGSRDLGAMLFCALLRSAAVETRLVCSLQVLPFSAVTKSQTPEKPRPEYAYRAAWPSQKIPIASREDPSNPQWRQSEYAGAAAPIPQGRQTKKKVHDSPYPIFWVEVMLPTNYTWIPLDPLVRKTMNKPKTGFEPPLSDSLNSMSYVIAFEETGFAKDVTRKYTQFFNAKIRKLRVESTKHGDYWWSVVVRWFRRFKPIRSDSDVNEDIELDKKSEGEPMPKNISDFKDHPVFALERHLRRNEVISPNEPRGFFSAGNKDGKSEKVYDRQKVHVVRSADQWYRKGRDLKVGEQPLKRVASQRRRRLSIDDDEDEEQDETSLYAEFQTEIYVPPPVVKGRIPKNQYGNLDVYVPTMIPPGAIHLQHPESRNAARILGIDFTDAVTGFKFKGRQGTAVVNGIVAAAEYRDALVEVVEALEYRRVSEQEEKRTMIALVMWKRFMTALRIRARIDEEHAEHDDAASATDSEVEGSAYVASDDGAGGGFMPDADEVNGDDDQFHAVDLAKLTLDPQQAVYHEVVVIESPHTTAGVNSSRTIPTSLRKDSLFDDNDGVDDLFNDKDEAEPGGFVREGSEAVEGGGFVVEDEAFEGGGGFIADEDEDIEEGGFGLDGRPGNSDDHERKHPVGSVDQLQGQQEAPAVQDQISHAEQTPTAVVVAPEACTSRVDEEEEQDDDATSLLSHDPEDDDAEEAWAMDIDG
jgi:xeroderma pigmentosum group C-complementing protein